VIAVTAGELPAVHYQLDRHLHVASITPTAYYENRFLSDLGPVQRQETLHRTLENVRVLTNRFAELPISASR